VEYPEHGDGDSDGGCIQAAMARLLEDEDGVTDGIGRRAVLHRVVPAGPVVQAGLLELPVLEFRHILLEYEEGGDRDGVEVDEEGVTMGNDDDKIENCEVNRHNKSDYSWGMEGSGDQLDEGTEVDELGDVPEGI
jgi:hypothetical protein